MRKLQRPLGFTGWRWDLLEEVRGRTLEIGCGWGSNFDHYPAEASILAFDIEPVRARSAHNKRSRVLLSAADAQQIPHPNHSFDSVVGTLVFCSIPQPHAALAEIRRVLKPNGKLFLIDHVRSHHHWLGSTQELLNPLWNTVTGGCNLNRDNESMVSEAGLKIEKLKVGWFGVLKLWVANRDA
ncbi:MAG: class I SAM-dependent methyltransferase [Chloroflexi bacterium]|nr:class I SAM-dependent methyltransferase [Chloroflexota bacterium]